jgi:hypothetical protein
MARDDVDVRSFSEAEFDFGALIGGGWTTYIARIGQFGQNRVQGPKITIRCNDAQNTLITFNCKPNKTIDFQQSFPEPSHSPEIVPRGTFFYRVAGGGLKGSFKRHIVLRGTMKSWPGRVSNAPKIVPRGTIWLLPG